MATRRGVKKKDFEKLDDATISRVIELLEQSQPITKKVACEMLNISYNTARLAKIIQEYKDKVAYTERRFKENRGKPFNDFEKKDLIVGYLSGESIASLARANFRTTHAVKTFLEQHNLPLRSSDATYHHPDLMPDEMVADSFEVGELVWSSRYNSVAEIRRPSKDGVYSIWVFGKHNQFAYQPVYELGKLDILKTLSLRDDEFVKTEKPNFAYRID